MTTPRPAPTRPGGTLALQASRADLEALARALDVPGHLVGTFVDRWGADPAAQVVAVHVARMRAAVHAVLDAGAGVPPASTP